MSDRCRLILPPLRRRCVQLCALECIGRFARGCASDGGRRHRGSSDVRAANDLFSLRRARRINARTSSRTVSLCAHGAVLH